MHHENIGKMIKRKKKCQNYGLEYISIWNTGKDNNYGGKKNILDQKT